MLDLDGATDKAWGGMTDLASKKALAGSWDYPIRIRQGLWEYQTQLEAVARHRINLEYAQRLVDEAEENLRALGVVGPLAGQRRT